VTRLGYILGVAAALFFWTAYVWREGFDGGASAAQCLHFHVSFGAEEAMKTEACQDAARRQRSDPFFLVFGKLTSDEG